MLKTRVGDRWRARTLHGGALLSDFRANVIAVQRCACERHALHLAAYQPPTQLDHIFDHPHLKWLADAPGIQISTPSSRSAAAKAKAREAAEAEERRRHRRSGRRGTANGTFNGTADGRENGTGNGTANGTANGPLDGTANGTADGTVDGTANGTELVHHRALLGANRTAMLLHLLDAQPASVRVWNGSHEEEVRVTACNGMT